MKFSDSIYLKVKIKSLAEEARIIRKEEGKACNDNWYNGLRRHRRFDVRSEARASQVAYAIIRGKDLKDVEPGAKTKPALLRVKTMVERYGVKPWLCSDKEQYNELKAAQDARLNAIMGT